MEERWTLSSEKARTAPGMLATQDERFRLMTQALSSLTVRRPKRKTGYILIK